MIGSVIAFAIVFIVIFTIVKYREKRERFVRENSAALATLSEINSRYSFLTVPSFDMIHDYDNGNYFDSISPKDYLTYQLVYKQRDVKKAIKDANSNGSLMNLYAAEINASCVLCEFGDVLYKKENSLLDTWLKRFWMTNGFDAVCACEKRLFDKEVKKPVTYFKINVRLYWTNIQGRRLSCKSNEFFEPEILEIIAKLQEKTNGYYTDPELWQSICRVERGKVSNKMRFAVYKRDGNRCRKCGSKYDLEVDHIYPISKGGKTSFDNLQTLCHRCNAEKSNRIEPYAVIPRNTKTTNHRICPNCRIALVRRKGKYGEFWGCPNYPNCKYTSQ